MMQAGVTRESIVHFVTSRLAERRGVLLVGDLGVGKSFLAEQVACAQPDCHVETLYGTPAVRQIPFGAAAHIIPDRAVSDPLWLLQLTRRLLDERADGRDLIVVVDDLDQVDPGTQALVHQLAVSRSAGVIATVRTDGASLPEIMPFWKDEHLVRVDLPPLNRTEHDAVVFRLLGRQPTRAQTDRIWALTRGNPLFIRELALSGLVGPDAPDDASLTPELIDATRLRDVVGRRLNDLPSPERAVIDAISLAEPLDEAVAHSLFEGETLVAVLRRTLVVTETIDDRTVYRTWHPLLAELVRAEMPAPTRTALLRTITNAMLVDPPDSATELRVASWLTDAGMDVDPDLAVRAARRALRVFDGAAALRLSEAALESGPSVERLTTWGEALSLVGRVDDAEAAFVDAEVHTSDETQLGVITSLRAMNLMHRGGRAREAAALLLERAGQLTDVHARANIESMLMQGEGMQGDFRRALDIGPKLRSQLDTGDIAELNVLVSLVVARTVTGRLEHVDDEVARGVELAHHLAERHPIEADQMLLNQVLFELTRHDIDACLRLIRERLSSSSGAADGPWLYFAAWVLSVAGDVDLARRAALTGFDRLADVDPIGLRVLAAGTSAMTHAQAGDIATATAMIERVATDPRSEQPRSQMFLSRATSWVLAHREGTSFGAEHAARRARFLDAAWHQTWGAWTAFDAVRLGHPDLVVDDLHRVAAESDDGAVRLFAQHARAFVEEDEPTLADLARRFEEMGARAHAAEAEAHAAAVSANPSTAARHQHRAHVLAQHCPGLASPAVSSIENPLSVREHEIAERAAAGRTSREIAEQLFVSSRTVDNHLGAVYAKLGLNGRTDLPPCFAVTHSVVDGYSIRL